MKYLRACFIAFLLLAVYGCATQPQQCEVKHRNYEVLERAAPTYPRSAYENDIEGWSIISVTITEKGKADDVKVIESNPEEVFDAVSIEAGYKMKFNPRIINCQPIPVYDVQYRHNFTLEDE